MAATLPRYAPQLCPLRYPFSTKHDIAPYLTSTAQSNVDGNYRFPYSLPIGDALVIREPLIMRRYHQNTAV